MPNGKTHDKITLVTTVPIIMIFFLVSHDLINSIIGGISYVFASMMFNGDLDTNSKPYNRWWIFKMIWIPYQLMFKHRSIFTHGIIIGTVVRLIYLSPILIPLYKLVYIPNDILIVILIGLEFGNTMHTIPDKIF